MTEKEIEEQLEIYKPYYISFKDEVLNFLNEIKQEHSESVEIYSIGGRIKEAKSIFGKISQNKNKYQKITDLQDITGVRVVCHCRSDLDRFDTILGEKLKVIYFNIKKTTHDKEDGYRGYTLFYK